MRIGIRKKAEPISSPVYNGILWMFVAGLRFLFRRIPSRRALATLPKLFGFTPKRRWPYLHKAAWADLNLGFDDLLEFQFYRSRKFTVLAVGAYDGLSNDPTGAFIRSHDCRAVLVEPNPIPYKKLSNLYSGCRNVELDCAAVDNAIGERTIYSVLPADGLPDWIDQLASFDKSHVLKYQKQFPAIGANLVERTVRTVTFDHLLSHYELNYLDVLQIDTEGMDGFLISLFPFERVRPAILHYETEHLSAVEREETRQRVVDLGYRIIPIEPKSDDIAIHL